MYLVMRVVDVEMAKPHPRQPTRETIIGDANVPILWFDLPTFLGHDDDPSFLLSTKLSINHSLLESTSLANREAHARGRP